jgi:SAM-dependent methyltransferase
MSTEPVRARADWLALREPADADARSVELVDELRRYLSTDGLEIHDLGCGTGSMARWLAGQLAGPQRWVLHDRDAELLDLAAANPPTRAADGAAVTVETRRDDITRLDPTDLAGADLITASALLDMLTAEELRRFVDTCATGGCPVLVTLSVVGRADIAPSNRLDQKVTDAFNAHQRRCTTGGRLLGPDAARAAVDAFQELGLQVLVRPSPWRLGPGHSVLAAQWFTGWLGAACEHAPELTAMTRPYATQRLSQAAQGTLTVTLHHQDLLALPKGDRQVANS